MSEKLKIVAYCSVAIIAIVTVIVTKEPVLPLVFSYFCIKHLAYYNDDEN